MCVVGGMSLPASRPLLPHTRNTHPHTAQAGVLSISQESAGLSSQLIELPAEVHVVGHHVHHSRSHRCIRRLESGDSRRHLADAHVLDIRPVAAVHAAVVR